MRVYNFGAGPATLPEAVLMEAQENCLDWQGQGMSVMEISHRSPAFMALLEETTELMKSLLSVPDDYHVLWIGAPARFHFSAIPLNFLKRSADYVVTGTWSELAYKDGLKTQRARLAGSNQEQNYLQLPQQYDFDPDADYCFYTPNETLTGLKCEQFDKRPLHVPLIADMTSCILSEVINIKDFDMILAGSQKNLAPSGLSVVIVSAAFLETAEQEGLGAFMSYGVHAKHASNYATPPTFNIYIANLVLKWLQEQGGVAAIQSVNEQKAQLLYDLIDNSAFYRSPIQKDARSTMNVAFNLADETLEENFLKQAKQEGLAALKGHRSIGGMRASIYNAMPLAGVQKLCQFMEQFAAKHMR
jgi:phosphoserine aminotransferase